MIELFIIILVLGLLLRSAKPIYIGLGIIILYFISLKQMKPSESFGNYGIYGQVDKSYYGDYDVPPGTPFFYGPQESLLLQPNFETQTDPSYINPNLPSPYQFPILNYGIGPQVYKTIDEVITAPDPDLFQKLPVLRAPTKNNPLMNVMPLDYDTSQTFDGYEKIFFQTPKSQQTRDQIKTQFEQGLFQNPSGAIWDRINSQRQFISQPVQSVPNAQSEFAHWLYGPNGGYVCKSGSIWDRYGVQFTDDSLVCNGFNVSSPTNKGLINGSLMSSVAND